MTTVGLTKGQVEELARAHGLVFAAGIIKKYLNLESLNPDEEAKDFTIFSLILYSNKSHIPRHNQNQKNTALALFKLGILQGLKDIWDSEQLDHEQRKTLRWIPDFIKAQCANIENNWPNSLTTSMFEKVNEIPVLALKIAIVLAAVSFIGLAIFAAMDYDMEFVKKYSLLILVSLCLKGVLSSCLWTGFETAIMILDEVKNSNKKYDEALKTVNKVYDSSRDLLKHGLNVYSNNQTQTLFGSVQDSTVPEETTPTTTPLAVNHRPGYKVNEV
jgi:hypothetical protein